MPPRRANAKSRVSAPPPPPPQSETQQRDRIRFYDRDSISENLICSICADIFNYPTALFCGHTFCRSCFEEWFRNSRTCPECRAPASIHQSHRDLLAHKFLDSVSVYCSYIGCLWIGRMDELQSHMSACDCNPAKFPEYMVTRQSENGPATSDLRMRLFRDNRELFEQFVSDSPGESTAPLRMETLSDMADRLASKRPRVDLSPAKPTSSAIVELSD